eukprot:281742_1
MQSNCVQQTIILKLSNDLNMFGCPFADQLTDVIHLIPLRQRFAQWIFSRFVQQPMDQTEIDLVELSTCLGLSSDPNIVKGECSVDDFLLFLRRATDLLGAKMSLSSSNMSDVNDEFEREQIVANHCQMLRYVADNHSQVLSDECRLFPLDIPVQNDLGKADFQERTSSLTRQLSSLKAELHVFLNSSATHSLSSSDNEGHTLRVIKMKSSLSRLQNIVSVSARATERSEQPERLSRDRQKKPNRSFLILPGILYSVCVVRIRSDIL